MPKVVHIEPGTRFGKWVVLGEAPSQPKKARRMLCRCDCGEEKGVNIHNLRNGQSTSCGCKLYKHGLSCSFAKSNPVGYKFYRTWALMKSRCSNTNNPRYKHYGGRGITVCDRWREFSAFYEDMWDSYIIHNEEHGGRQTSLDRIDNDDGYYPENCRWATARQQGLNRRPNYRIGYIVYKNVSYGRSEFAKLYNVPVTSLSRGMSHDEITFLVMGTHERLKRTAEAQLWDEMLREVECLDRNSQIYCLNDAGFSHHKVGGHFGLSRQRVSQICLNWK